MPDGTFLARSLGANFLEFISKFRLSPDTERPFLSHNTVCGAKGCFRKFQRLWGAFCILRRSGRLPRVIDFFSPPLLGGT